MHELAHCKEMNHSRSFWKVRNGYAEQMEGLWSRKYSGEGLWGRGKELVSGAFVHESMPVDAQIPEHLCGGTYRRARGKKRKRDQADVGGDGGKAKVTYAERQQKRIAKKFGKHGEGSALGDDELVRGALDGKSGKRHAGKPRVAKSKRGRELRANAALARFEALTKKQASSESTPELEDDQGSETESCWSSDDDIDSSEAIILRKKGGQVKDHDGRDLVRVCGDEDGQDSGGENELDDLRILRGRPKGFPQNPAMKTKLGEQIQETKSESRTTTIDDGSETESEVDLLHVDAAKPHSSKLNPSEHAVNESETESEAETSPNRTHQSRTRANQRYSKSSEDTVCTANLLSDPPPPPPVATALPTPTPINPAPADTAPKTLDASLLGVCIMCSFENSPDSSTCLTCSHVLRPSLVKGVWRCKSVTCSGSAYVNAGDVGRCGLCGGKKPVVAGATVAKPMGVLSTDVLRWD